MVLPRRHNQHGNTLIASLVFIAAIVVVGTIGWQVSHRAKQNQANPPATPTPNLTGPSYFLGWWADNRSVITLAQVGAEQSKPVAALPATIKNVYIVGPKTLI